MSAAAGSTWTPQDSKTEFPRFFDKAPLGMAQCQRQGNITALNPILEQMIGGHSGIRRPLCFGDLFPTQTRSEGERLFAELFEGCRDSFQIDSKTVGPQDQLVRWTAWRVPGRDGAPDYALAIAESLSLARATEQRLRQAERLEAVGRLAGGVAHDFNNLLTGVLLYCDLLMANLEPGHHVRKYAEEIRKAGLQATGLVRQLLAIARPTNSEPRPLSLNEIAEAMRNLLVRLIGENIELKFRLDPNLGLIKMDPTQSQQVLLNLVLNARDAMPNGGQITIETRSCKVQILSDPDCQTINETSLPCALLVISDNGSGMDEATRAHLFEAFFTTKAGKGTGLGLATVNDIVTSNGGLIHVDSALGFGTRVSVLLPLIPPSFLNTGQKNNFEFDETPNTLQNEEKE